MPPDLLPIKQVAAGFGIAETELYLYGPFKAKLEPSLARRLPQCSTCGRQVLVTATTPTPAGEGKTTTAIGLSMALNKTGHKSIVTLREPSLGPVFGMKGGATGGGASRVLPSDEIDLHFTGDIHAVTTANNLLAAMIDNHIQHGNQLGIDTRRIAWRRVIDMNDRALREIVIGLGGRQNGFAREDAFNISVASEVMAVLCLAEDFADLKARLARMVVGYTSRSKPVTAADLRAVGSMALLLKDAIKPNLVQTSEGTPAIIHGGPFANIAHGTNSLQAIRLAQSLAEITVTEAGFASELGGEKFMDFVCQVGKFNVDAVVLVTTLRALKYHGGAAKENLAEKNLEALIKGFDNLDKHIQNMQSFGIPLVVALNYFPDNDPEELELTLKHVRSKNAKAVISDPYNKGSQGCLELAREVDAASRTGAVVKPIYQTEWAIGRKIETIATRMYGAARINYTRQARKDIDLLNKLGYGSLHVIIAKTPSSLSDDPRAIGRPLNFDVDVDRVFLSAGAGFVVAVCGEIMLMPGLPAEPAAQSIDIDQDGNITGLF
ncbi:MAG: formate--tetrahydrofolate ligase [Candidatus Edwardsbacteria bacterium RIFOXYD12_FULL_50_11]|uniref:Formate--tetrahydrofolate ligase n=1 Tax=Candidatus Edwardsbacteria bacterium GWF2_54_11 TaxID=1817851 RepID=A0A1F5RBY9_9BACT|nr:MAG: formate--tetrahydrofolate ligase [Candidatus Edwardsbacteria bacterium RifOxyC12_full_54_24]OGF07399.1 MAG: formate--tetrahydrofolate ligase [Candidatus Edwardsbacteria bacterium RifOxyA12_full_54_48]OGF09651.1 MAG: formate--tetrahydrofolate ligase [Candidatus Edwardsbacteria bacterium GWE2_54_12]OGF11912.1 MAG: formate--tetrahydrofolate ligase [Candidatus Edwardsbacteria bacterium GWF2_54_11]OGF18094.1 MAG: formate--tetrahydrofolate ligase [Candidatus Edwardsbacteria bacterium RIFOXYD1